MKTIFFNYPTGTAKVVFTVSDKSVDELRSAGIIPATSVTFSHDLIDENSSIEERALTAFPDRCEFDDISNPTGVRLDQELINSFMLTEMKAARGQCLSELDAVQLRAMAQGETLVVTNIEKDKKALRNMPETINWSKAVNYQTSYEIIPSMLLVDYIEKYQDALS
jgi:hypothetical protein|tara:strand:- start:2567 stop:3064 length:498 start_codon:yes stop_codon:yes gene_type:complete